MKVLVLRFSSIGDIVLTTPVVRALKKQIPNIEIHYATKQPFKVVLADNPYIDKLYLLEKNNLPQLLKQWKSEKYDYIIDLHHNLRTLRIKLALGVKAYSFDKLNMEKWLLVRFKINRMPAMHIVDRYMATVAPLGVHTDQEGLDYFIPEKDVVQPCDIPTSHRNGYAAIAIGAQHFTKRLPLHKLIELCQRIPAPVTLLGGKEDIVVAQKIEEYFLANNQPNKVFNACGKFNLNQSASLLQQAQVVYSHDTGLMHIAAALHKKIYSIWGNTTPLLGMYPYRTDYVVIENKELSCRPCSKIGYNHCPQKHFKCMNDLDLSAYIG
ncbi:ADP-heptose:LPS heptosyltransferase [Flexibacter flexilis DSM 6793]|uniref:ADP-heptose:LPS heptosyltransferase n=1 Tax=Flexibacter flexilis DSM 6793 TaxID=927664 RepID=A0A1I1FIF0_9BACT|nr:glycosyltransferase family 9 protein [Flexibacter flexilis]SFB98746.1 ADP-heptose:LPS heptosyltransferase [Flexibacter flexilis DSM 6793]